MVLSSKSFGVAFVIFVLLLAFAYAVKDQFFPTPASKRECRESAELKEALKDSSISLRNGDLIFRRGKSLVSHLVLMCDSKTAYSHVGLIVKKNSGTYVVHATPGENRPNQPELVKCEPLMDFLTPDKSAEFAICGTQTQHRAVAEEAAKVALSYVEEKRTFDHDFDLENSQTLYCTELVWTAYKTAGVEVVSHLDSVATPLSSTTLILPSSLFESLFFKQIYPNTPQ